MIRAVVTGATGLLGSHLVVELLRAGGYTVVAPFRSESSVAKLGSVLARYGFSTENVVLVSCDIADFEQSCTLISDADVVFHTAALVNFNSNDDIVATNVQLTQNVVQACLSAPTPPLLVHTSSIAALGVVPYPEVITELTPFTNIINSSCYAQSKFLSENEVWRSHGLGLRCVVVNPSVILGGLGGGMKPIFDWVRRTGMPFYTDGVMGFVDVVDVAHAMRLLSQEPQSWGHRYLISGFNLSFREFICALNSANYRLRPWFRVPRWLARFVIFILQMFMRHPPLTPAMLGFLFGKTLYDGSLIERTVDFRYSQFSDTCNSIFGGETH
ncbi:MAG: NAD-dependent epimerase/dehydratase family protein [Mucinivorans sp.]